MLTYNRANYIEKAIGSVVAQTYQNWELFVIDDGSTDSTAEIMAAYTDPRIHYIHHSDNQKLLARRKESLTYVTGKYAAVLDSDDIWIDTDKLSQQVTFLENNPEYVIVGTDITLINETGADIGDDSYPASDALTRGQALLHNPFAHSSVLMRADALRKTEGYRARLEDYDLFLQLGRIGKFANISKPMVAYRKHSGGDSNRKTLAREMLSVVWNFRSDYPNSIQGILFALLRIIKSTIS